MASKLLMCFVLTTALPLALASCQESRMVCGRLGVPQDTPQEVFRAYAAYYRHGQYEKVAECVDPALRRAVRLALDQKREFDCLTKSLKAELDARWGSKMVGKFSECIVEQFDDIFARGIMFRREQDDFGKSEFVRVGRAVLALQDGIPFGLIAVEHRGRWFLSHENGESFLAELSYLRLFMKEVNGFLRRLCVQVQEAAQQDEVERMLAEPDLSGVAKGRGGRSRSRAEGVGH